MVLATPEQYRKMIDSAKAGGYAYPAVNVTSSQTLNAVLQGLTEAGSDGILQISFGGAEYMSGSTIKDKVSGSIAFAKFAAEIAKNYPITVALHTDHCPKEHLESWVYPLLQASRENIAAGGAPLFQSHMWDGSAVPLEENLEIAKKLLKECAELDIILEVEIGVVGGEEDGIVHEINEQLYTTLEDAVATVEALGLGEKGRYMTALTFGNVHGVYKPGNVHLRPELLAEIQQGLAEKYGTEPKPLDLVFHGGSGSTPEEIAEAVSNGVIKMNIDTDTQYAFTRGAVDQIFTNYSGVLKIDGEVGNKKLYDPRAWGKAGEASMAKRVAEAAAQLGSAGKSISI
ncbi:MAG: class II fructose-bisphosphate aldolase [Microbacteriaceae bacterium]|nr:class II fructose-bisphosphate aldolase [Microbacteriaceae bacterium]